MDSISKLGALLGFFEPYSRQSRPTENPELVWGAGLYRFGLQAKYLVDISTMAA